MNKSDFIKILEDENDKVHPAFSAGFSVENDFYDGPFDVILKAMQVVYDKGFEDGKNS